MCRSTQLDSNSVPIHKEVVFKSQIVNTHGARNRDGEGLVKGLFIFFNVYICVCQKKALGLFFHHSPPVSLRQNLRLLCPARVEARKFQRSFGLALLGSGVPGTCKKHLQLVALVLGSELQASCLHIRPSGLSSHLSSP